MAVGLMLIDIEKPRSAGVSRPAADAHVLRGACFTCLDGDLTFAGGDKLRALIEIRLLVMYKERCQNTVSRLTFSYDDQDR